MPDSEGPASERIRVLLTSVPALMAAVVAERIRAQPDMMLDDATSADDEGALVARRDIDVVVTAYTGPRLTPAQERLLLEAPHRPIIALSSSGRSMDVYDHRLIRDVDPDHVVEAIRRVALWKRHEARTT